MAARDIHHRPAEVAGRLHPPARPPPAPAARPPACAAGSAYVLAILVLGIFASLAVALAAEAGIGLRKANNEVRIHAARLEAEGGMAFLAHVMRQIQMPGGLSDDQRVQRLRDSLQALLVGSLDGQQVQKVDLAVVVPAIATAAGRSFTAGAELNADGAFRLSVQGQALNCARGVRMDFEAVGGGSAVFDYGVASRSRVKMTGNARILGASDPAEAHILSATYTESEAVNLTGNCCLEGDVFVSNPSATVSLTGNITIGGESVWGGDIYDHIHIGMGDVEFPEADPGIFEPYATNIVDSSTSTSGNKTFTNIRILAGTNPNFSGNIKLYGVVFIETPNKVKFAGNLSITGVVVTQDAGEGDLDNNYLHFTGNTTVKGVEQLPDGPEFAGVKELPGTFLLAPGFATKFTGNFGTVSGTMAADEFQFTGNAGGVVHGWIINWGDTEFKLTGNANLTMDQSGLTTLPFGFSLPTMLSPMPTSYEEF